MRRYDVKKSKEGYKFIEVGCVQHYKPEYRVWINRMVKTELDDGNEYISFPMTGRVVVTEKGNFVLVNDDSYVFDVFKKCGYRGMSSVIPYDCEVVFKYKEYDSPQGNLGISEGCFVNTKNKYVIYEWERTGRLYGGKSSGKSKIDVYGDISDIPDDDVEKYL